MSASEMSDVKQKKKCLSEHSDEGWVSATGISNVYVIMFYIRQMEFFWKGSEFRKGSEGKGRIIVLIHLFCYTCPLDNMQFI